MSAQLERQRTTPALPCLATAPKTILVIDDSEMICDLVSRVLRDGGYHVLTAPDKSGLFVGLAARPDLILLDLGLPDSDGGEISRLFKTNRVTCTIPIIMMTGSSLGMVQDVGAQADGYLPKPFGAATLLKTVSFYITS